MVNYAVSLCGDIMFRENRMYMLEGKVYRNTFDLIYNNCVIEDIYISAKR